MYRTYRIDSLLGDTFYREGLVYVQNGYGIIDIINELSLYATTLHPYPQPATGPLSPLFHPISPIILIDQSKSGGRDDGLTNYDDISTGILKDHPFIGVRYTTESYWTKYELSYLDSHHLVPLNMNKNFKKEKKYKRYNWWRCVSMRPLKSQSMYQRNW